VKKFIPEKERPKRVKSKSRVRKAATPGKRPCNTRKNSDIPALLSRYPGGVWKTMLRLRKIIRTTLPESTESVSRNKKLIRYSIVDGTRNHFCCYIAPAEDHVKLGIDSGKTLSGAHALLPQTGARIRHITIRIDAPIPVKAVQSLLVEAAIHLLLRRAISPGR
jgi:hypothetical protein